jgi:energy-coupling factor transporter transmembrane protein EcfT
MAMESRGFSIRGKRTSIIQIKFIKKDYLFTIFNIILTIIFILLRIIGYGAIIPQVL